MNLISANLTCANLPQVNVGQVTANLTLVHLTKQMSPLTTKQHCVDYEVILILMLATSVHKQGEHGLVWC